MGITESLVAFIEKQVSTDEFEKGELLLGKKEKRFRYEQTSYGEYVVYVPREKGNELLQVYFNNESDDLYVTCPCTVAKNNGICPHVVAAAIYLEDALFEENFEDEEQEELHSIEVNPSEEGYTFFTMFNIDHYYLTNLAGGWNGVGDQFVRKVTPLDLTTPHHKFLFSDKKKKNLTIDIIYDGKDGFKTRCSCDQQTLTICEHIVACFVYLERHYDRHHFIKWKDFTSEKNTILQRYGLTVDDPEAKDFNFEIDRWVGKLVLRNPPNFIIPVGSKGVYEELKKSFMGSETVTHASFRPRLAESVIIDYEIGFVFNFVASKHFGFDLETAFVRQKGNVKDVKKLVYHKESNWPFLQTLPDDLYNPLMEFYEKNMITWLASNGGSRLTNYSNPWAYVHIDDVDKIKRRYYQLLQKIWTRLSEWPDVYSLASGTFSNKNVKPIKIGKDPIPLSFVAEADSRFITVKCKPLFPEHVTTSKGITIWRAMFFEVDDTLYLPASVDCLSILEKFGAGILKFPIGEMREVLINVLGPLQAKYPVDMQSLPQIESISTDPQPRVMLSEMNSQHLLIKPQFLYDEILVDYNEDHEHVVEDEGKLKIIKRNKAEEKKVYEYFRTLHPKFSNQRNNLYYYLSFTEVMVNNWFLTAIQQIQEAGITVFGLQELKKFKYNTNKAKFEIKTGSGVDWFDLKISVSWGDQELSLKEIRKAILNKQDAVLLGDGTLGLVPQEWLKQYAPLMKMATDESGSTLRLSKLHYALLDDIDDKLDSDEVRLEIAEKKKKLLQYDKIATVAPSSAIHAELRPYQLSGFNWMQSLHELGWGGCLADDMGLGKTLQTITFLQYLNEKSPSSTHLVICPTSLIFNWESELQKFCPSLKYHTYYGAQRTFDDEHFEQFNLVLTTYGMVRSDFEQLQKFSWHYVILDESQAIKNPEALVTKAVQKLQAKNKLILSGTPVQNNTYDLYAQFTFLNPGFLGNREFFKNEFAQPIDKQGDKEKAEQLRRMIYPFMLRRTKEQVAKDLPDKTEMILWCHMEKEQRHVYDQYKEYYRDMLMQKIDEGGLAKAGIYVLEGLLRLRQICDHPSLVKDKKIKATESVKINELMREIRENTGDHKLLIFSQFTEMLSLVRDELVKENVHFCYLDGSTPAHQRKEQVNKFQENETIKVFLISLKAGGVGLNLTMADYVYLVDPWWNPAAEQQAIDRTHRIGQTKKVFAYKMICKESVEEKILQLQEKKKLLVNELVSEEAGFVKKLTRNDIEYLFS